MSDLKNKPIHPHEVWLESPHLLRGGRYEKRPGITLREYYAGLAHTSPNCPCNFHDHQGRAAWAVKEADALIAELEKTYQ